MCAKHGSEIFRFFNKVDKDTPLGCWQWQGRINPKGYGIFQGRMAHRFSFILANGEIPDGLEIDHLCRNRGCVRPNHLELVTHSENLKRGIVGRKNHNAFKTHCKYGHEFTPENTYRYPETSLYAEKRICRACQKRHERIRRLGRGVG